jgi:hypothetical protein
MKTLFLNWFKSNSFPFTKPTDSNGYQKTKRPIAQGLAGATHLP